MTGPQLQPDWSMLMGLIGGVPSTLPPINQQFLASNSTVAPSPRDELAKNGITNEQRSAYVPRISEALYKYISPNSYELGQGQLHKSFLGILREVVAPTPDQPVRDFSNGRRGVLGPGAEDSWRLYLGMPQTNGTFDISEHRPSKSTDTTKHYLAIKDFLPRYLAANARLDESGNLKKETLKDLVASIDASPNGRIQRNDDEAEPSANLGIMRNFQFSKGKDEHGHYIAYYDTWDLHTKGAEVIGKPYEIYDRVYYDPKTFKLLTPKKEK